MRMRHAAVMAGLALGLMSGAAKAAYVIDIYQNGNNVIAYGSGSVETGGLIDDGAIKTSDGIQSNGAFVVLNGATVESYEGITGPTSFGTNGFGTPTASTGNFVGIYGNGNAYQSPSPTQIYLPVGYVSGTNLGISTATFTNTTLGGLGLTAGTSFDYIFPGDKGDGIDTFTVNVGVSPVPLPASAPMFGAALMALGAVGYGVKRKKAAAAA